AATIAGAVSGFVQVLVEYPIDTLKTRVSAQFLDHNKGSHEWRTPRHVLVGTLRNEGVTALWQGASSRFATLSLIKASQFSLYQRFLNATGGQPAMSGFLTGIVNTYCTVPVDVIKCRLQVYRRNTVPAAGGAGVGGPPPPTAPSSRPSVVRLVAGLLRNHGVAAFYAGWAAHAARDAVGYAALFTAFTSLRQRTDLPMPVCGAAAGVCFYLVALPADRVKVLMQTQDLAHPRRFAGAVACWRHVWRTEGLRGAYLGCTPALLKTVVGQGAALFAYEAVHGRLVVGDGKEGER
ncbi:unnamed protein product, partial [Phaeothamnion confervicola]